VGNAVGVDVNAEVIDLARERCSSMGSPATFRVASLADLGESNELREFDAVYARCVLSHQSDPRAGLRSMLAAVRPGGTVLIEDVEVAAIWSSPRNDALSRHIELYLAAAHGLGAHPDVGCELAVILRELGATEVHVDILQPVLRVPDDIRAHAATMAAIAGPVIQQRLATEAEVAQLVADLDAFANTPGAVATLPRVIQVSARAAG
jgi:SAM-dependent methyltransferase